jgi:hypothetical protein
MTNKTTPDEDWLGKILDEVYENGYNWGDGFHPLLSANEVQAKAEAAINAKITELLIAELNGVTEQYSNIYGLEVARLGLSKEEPFTVFHRIISDRIQELQASQPINLNESEM